MSRLCRIIVLAAIAWLGVSSAALADDGACAGDLNCDGQVGISDLLHLLSEWGEPGSDADLTGDGAVGVADLLALLALWGPCPPTDVTTFYCSADAGDGGDGTRCHPFNSLKDLAQAINAASAPKVKALVTGTFRNQPINLVGSARAIELRQWPDMPQFITRGDTPLATLVSIGGDLYTSAIQPGLFINAFISVRRFRRLMRPPVRPCPLIPNSPATGEGRRRRRFRRG